jgi:hypothetical protein
VLEALVERGRLAQPGSPDQPDLPGVLAPVELPGQPVQPVAVAGASTQVLALQTWSRYQLGHLVG